MREITAEEIEVCGNWILEDGVVADEKCHRIEWLISNWLQRVGTDCSGWEVLYKDPHDGRYWELTYPQSELHGGGPPTLRYISDKSAKLKYERKSAPNHSAADGLR